MQPLGCPRGGGLHDGDDAGEVGGGAVLAAHPGRRPWPGTGSSHNRSAGTARHTRSTCAASHHARPSRCAPGRQAPAVQLTCSTVLTSLQTRQATRDLPSPRGTSAASAAMAALQLPGELRGRCAPARVQEGPIRSPGAKMETALAGQCWVPSVLSSLAQAPS